MMKINEKNERVKRAYAIHLADAAKASEATIDQALAAICQFEEVTKGKDFASFRIEDARRYKKFLSDQKSASTGKSLALSTVRSRLMGLRTFFRWLSREPGYRSKVNYNDADYFNQNANDERVALAVRERPVPTLDHIRAAIKAMSGSDVLLRRARGLLAFAILTGARDSALASLQLRHVDLSEGRIDQDARIVKTKRRKTFSTWFIPVGDDFIVEAESWVGYLIDQLGFGPDDPLFPTTALTQDGQKRFAPEGVLRRPWSNADPVRKIFREAFERAGLPYFHPHSFRKTLTRWVMRQGCTDETLKAFSQNIGHEDVMTTVGSYGHVDSMRQGELVRSLRPAPGMSEKSGKPDSDTIQWVLDHLKKSAV